MNKYAIDINKEETYIGYMNRKTIYNLYLPPSTKMLKKYRAESADGLPYCYDISIIRHKVESKCTEDRFCYTEDTVFNQYGHISICYIYIYIIR